MRKRFGPSTRTTVNEPFSAACTASATPLIATTVAGTPPNCGLPSEKPCGVAVVMSRAQSAADGGTDVDARDVAMAVGAGLDHADDSVHLRGRQIHVARDRRILLVRTSGLPSSGFVRAGSTRRRWYRQRVAGAARGVVDDDIEAAETRLAVVDVAVRRMLPSNTVVDQLHGLQGIRIDGPVTARTCPRRSPRRHRRAGVRDLRAADRMAAIRCHRGPLLLIVQFAGMVGCRRWRR